MSSRLLNWHLNNLEYIFICACKRLHCLLNCRHSFLFYFLLDRSLRRKTKTRATKVRVISRVFSFFVFHETTQRKKSGKEKGAPREKVKRLLVSTTDHIWHFSLGPPPALFRGIPPPPLPQKLMCHEGMLRC